MNYRENPSINEHLTPYDVINAFRPSEKLAFKTMTCKELDYLRYECGIIDYVNYIHDYHRFQNYDSTEPIPVIHGTKFQLERYVLTLKATLIDYDGDMSCYLSDINIEAYDLINELKTFSGLLIIKIPEGSSSTVGMDTFRSEIISGILTTRRDYARPTVVLAEIKISGRLFKDNDLTNYYYLSGKKLRTTLRGVSSEASEDIQSRDNVSTTVAKAVAVTATASTTRDVYIPPSPQQLDAEEKAKKMNKRYKG